ncbi:MAG: hypothetical protein U0Z26_04555 [Anaerolineales bacterium]
MFNSYQYSGSYSDLLKRMTSRAKQNEVDAQIFEVIKTFFEKELSKENMILSRPERVRLLQEVINAIFSEVNERIDSSK